MLGKIGEDMAPQISFDHLEKANQTLKDALVPKNTLERDGCNQRFEYTFELSWKLLRKALLSLGRTEVSASPKPILRDAAQEGWIDDLAQWLEFSEVRNLTSHVYKEDIADKVFEVAKKFPTAVDALLSKLKAVRF
jgi:nucleotidyltransferase substrate binding protein (TIGR01987 family)